MNAVDSDEDLFRLVPVLGHSTQVLPLELVPSAQICVRAPVKGCVQTGARACARAPSLKGPKRIRLIFFKFIICK